MKAGDCFRLTNPIPGEDDHIWVVISDPVNFPNDVMAVNFTTYEDWKDSSCIVGTDECSLLKDQSCIWYRSPETFTVAEYDAKIASRDMRFLGNVGPDVLTVIREGALESPQFAPDDADFLRTQGVFKGLE